MGDKGSGSLLGALGRTPRVCASLVRARDCVVILIFGTYVRIIFSPRRGEVSQLALLARGIGISLSESHLEYVRNMYSPRRILMSLHRCVENPGVLNVTLYPRGVEEGRLPHTAVSAA